VPRTPRRAEWYLVRHAIAEPRGSRWPDDTRRPLSRGGVRRFTEVARGLRALGVECERVLTSPLVRATQTARLLSKGLGGRPRMSVTAALAPGVAAARVVAECSRLAGARRVALVGHEPDLGVLAAFLVGARAPFPLKKGGICRIDVPAHRVGPGTGTLVWFAPPRLLRRVGRREGDSSP
jgi:phosphohistidine phosphatase